MSSYKTDQRHLTHRGTEFHFVSYGGQLANPNRGVEAAPPTWFLMKAGKRWEVFPEVEGQPEEELDQHLTDWLEDNVF